MQGIRNTIALYYRRVSLILFFFICVFTFYSSSAQQNFYDKDLLPTSFHQSKRAALRAAMPENSIAVIFSNPVRNRSNDVNFQFSQDPDLYYLTGITQPHSALILFKNAMEIEGNNINEILFVQDRDKSKEIWDGRRLSLEEATAVSGITTVRLNIDFENVLPSLTKFDLVLLKSPVDIDSETGNKGSLNFMVRTLNKEIKYSGVSYKSAPLLSMLAGLREIKWEAEIKLMQKAVDMTVDGLNEVIMAIEPGITEYKAQAIVEYYFRQNGSEYPGYGSISGGGENSCVLHYVTNRKKLESGDLLLMDMGAEYHGYTADITRTVPVNGKFTDEQKIIYELVLMAQTAAIEVCVKNNSFYEPNKVAQKVIFDGLTDLGILKKDESVRMYFNHGTSHYLGLEVHDAGLYGNLKPGMVITVEPGIYIPEGSDCDKKWWNIGIRIEDDVLITDNQPFVMSGALVKKVDDIEELMRKKSLFNEIK